MLPVHANFTLHRTESEITVLCGFTVQFWSFEDGYLQWAGEDIHKTDEEELWSPDTPLVAWSLSPTNP